MLALGMPVPRFQAASSVNPKFNFDTVAGRYVVVSFIGSSRSPLSQRLLAEVAARDAEFDVTNLLFFGVTNDPADVQNLTHESNGRLFFYDLDSQVSKLFGVLQENREPGASTGRSRLTLTTFVLDQALRVVARIGLDDNVTGHVDAILNFVRSLPPLSSLTSQAPVLIVPYVFEPELCKELIHYYETKGGEDSGYMTEVDGKTVGVYDYSHKRRMDCEIVDSDLIKKTHERVLARLLPAIRQAYMFQVTRIERNIVACYDAAQGAHFKAHRDNTTLGTAHRRFAITLNLNSEEYEGGEICFPEFGPKRFKAPSGAAIVFSCSLLHEVPKVTRGRRYAFLPFLYDEAARAVRDRNYQYVAGPTVTPGAQPSNCNATPTAAVPEAPKPAVKVPLLDGTCGCGNPNGCATCLSAATYPLGTPAGRA